MASIASWIYDKPLRGNYTFTHDEVAQAFPDMSAGSIARALTRVVSKGRIMSPLRGFYVIVPDEYVLRGAVGLCRSHFTWMTWCTTWDANTMWLC